MSARGWLAPRHGRRPVSRWRRRLGLAALLLLILAVVGYNRVTSEARLRGFAERWLEGFSGGQVHIDRLQFNLFSGLQLVGVRIVPPPQAEFFPPDTPQEEQVLFSAGTLFLRLRPLSIISGNLVVPEIIAVNPKLTLVQRAPDGLSNWQAMLANRPQRGPGGKPPRLPAIRLRNVEVQQFRINERGRSGGAVQVFYADAQPLPGKAQAYDLRVTKLVPTSRPAELVGETGRLEIDLETLVIAGSLPSLNMEELVFAAPPDIQRWLETLDLRGFVRAETFVYDPRSHGRASLSLRDAQLSIPLDASEAAGAVEDRYVHFSGLAGTITFDGHAAEVSLEGRFREGPIKLAGRLTLPDGPVSGLSGIGLDVDITATALQMPRNDPETPPAERRFVQRWKRLQEFVYDFDGKGPTDLWLRLHKEPGSDKGVEFIEGRMDVRGLSAAFYKFPYRIFDITGQVVFRKDGLIDIIDLGGRHGEGSVRVNGQVTGFSPAEPAHLMIAGRGLALGEDLLTCMSPRHRELCRMFLQRSNLDLDVQLDRAQAPPTWRSGPWTNVIDATLSDARMEYAGFPYWLEQVRGRLRIAEDRLTIHELAGIHGSAKVEVSGTASLAAGQPAHIDMRVRASDVELGKDVAAALPERPRAFYSRLDPRGMLTLSGRVFTPAPGEPLRYELDAGVARGDMAMPFGKGRLSDIEAAFRIQPETLLINRCDGRFGPSPVSLTGRLQADGDETLYDLHIKSDRLRLDEALQAALPPAAGAAFDRFKPAGDIGLDLQVAHQFPTSRPARDTQPAEPASRPAVAEDSYVAVIEPLGCAITFDEFPLPLSDVRGLVVATPNKAEVRRLDGRYQEAATSISGLITSSDQGTDAELNIAARNVPLDEGLRMAVPWRLRRLWNDVRPTGRFDLDLRSLQLHRDGRGRTSNRYHGRITLHQAGLSIGPELSDIQGSIEAAGGYDGEFDIRGEADLERIRIGGRLLSNVKAGLERLPRGTMFRVHDVVGQLYGGDFLGTFEVDYSGEHTRFGVNISAREVSLQEFLNARDDTGTGPVRLQGRVEGTLALAGTFDRPDTRHGHGTVMVRDAQFLRMPMILKVLQFVHLSPGDDNAFHDALFDFIVDGDELVLNNIDLRGRAVSMVGAGRVNVTTRAMDIVLLVGSPLELPRIEVLTELAEGLAREIMQVRVGGRLDAPEFRPELIRGLKRGLDAMAAVRRTPETPPR